MEQKSQQDYLRASYTLLERKNNGSLGVKSVDIAQFLGISKAGVSQMIKRLSQKGLIKSDSYSNVFLTTKGLGLAKRITHNYRVIEVFLKNTLGYNSPDKLRQEAHKLEHAFSDALIKRLDIFLHHPKKCPHGDLIHEK